MKPYITTFIIFLTMVLTLAVTTLFSSSETATTVEYDSGYEDGYHRAMQDMEYTRQTTENPHY